MLPLGLKGGICHFLKWQIRPFNAKRVSVLADVTSVNQQGRWITPALLMNKKWRFLFSVFFKLFFSWVHELQTSNINVFMNGNNYLVAYVNRTLLFQMTSLARRGWHIKVHPYIFPCDTGPPPHSGRQGMMSTQFQGEFSKFNTQLIPNRHNTFV